MNSKLVVVLVAVVAAAFVSLGSQSQRDGVEMLEITLDNVELIPVDGAAGPESLAFDGKGEGPYTGVSDGRILKWLPRERRWVEHSSSAPQLVDKCRASRDPKREHECGRPLGLKFDDDTGDLYVADAYLGLRVIGPKDNVSRPLVSESQGTPLVFTNSVEINPETGVIYFTDSSTKFYRRDYLKIITYGDKTGRLMKYDPKNNHVEVLVNGLSFINGLTMSKDGSSLLVAETTTGKILKYWLKTSKASTLEEVVQLSWFPDNIKKSPRGGFWVGLHAKRGKIVEWAFSYSWLRKMIFKLSIHRIQHILSLLNQFDRQVIAIRLSENGKIMEAISVYGAAREILKSISEVEERNGRLWIGSVASPFLGLFHL